MRGRPRVELRRWLGRAGGVTLALLGLALAIGPTRWAADGPAPDVVEMPLPYAGPGVGGWSGIDVSADGTQFWAVTDAGFRTEGRLVRGPDGVLLGIDAPPPRRLTGLRGRAEIAEPDDAEGIDADPTTGETVIAFEGFSRLRRYAAPRSDALWLPDLPRLPVRGTNNGTESVARDAEGRLYTLPEAPDWGRGTVPLLRLTLRNRARLDLNQWEVPATVTLPGAWRIVGADVAPDGMLYLLERRLRHVGFTSRIRRFDLSILADQPDPTDELPLLTGEIVYTSPPRRHGNLEGIGLWVDAQGQLRAVMVSDDNESHWQRGDLVELIVPSVAGDPPLDPGGRDE